MDLEAKLGMSDSATTDCLEEVFEGDQLDCECVLSLEAVAALKKSEGLRLERYRPPASDHAFVRYATDILGCSLGDALVASASIERAWPADDVACVTSAPELEEKVDDSLRFMDSDRLADAFADSLPAQHPVSPQLLYQPQVAATTTGSNAAATNFQLPCISTNNSEQLVDDAVLIPARKPVSQNLLSQPQVAATTTGVNASVTNFEMLPCSSTNHLEHLVVDAVLIPAEQPVSQDLLSQPQAAATTTGADAAAANLEMLPCSSTTHLENLVADSSLIPAQQTVSHNLVVKTGCAVNTDVELPRLPSNNTNNTERFPVDTGFKKVATHASEAQSAAVPLQKKRKMVPEAVMEKKRKKSKRVPLPENCRNIRCQTEPVPPVKMPEPKAFAIVVPKLSDGFIRKNVKKDVRTLPKIPKLAPGKVPTGMRHFGRSPGKAHNYVSALGKKRKRAEMAPDERVDERRDQLRKQARLLSRQFASRKHLGNSATPEPSGNATRETDGLMGKAMPPRPASLPTALVECVPATSTDSTPTSTAVSHSIFSVTPPPFATVRRVVWHPFRVLFPRGRPTKQIVKHKYPLLRIQLFGCDTVTHPDGSKLPKMEDIMAYQGARIFKAAHQYHRIERAYDLETSGRLPPPRFLNRRAYRDYNEEEYQELRQLDSEQKKQQEKNMEDHWTHRQLKNAVKNRQLDELERSYSGNDDILTMRVNFRHMLTHHCFSRYGDECWMKSALLKGEPRSIESFQRENCVSRWTRWQWEQRPMAIERMRTTREYVVAEEDLRSFVPVIWQDYDGPLARQILGLYFNFFPPTLNEIYVKQPSILEGVPPRFWSRKPSIKINDSDSPPPDDPTTSAEPPRMEKIHVVEKDRKPYTVDMEVDEDGPPLPSEPIPPPPPPPLPIEGPPNTIPPPPPKEPPPNDSASFTQPNPIPSSIAPKPVFDYSHGLRAQSASQLSCPSQQFDPIERTVDLYTKGHYSVGSEWY